MESRQMRLPISLVLFTALSILFTLGIILNYTVLPVNARVLMIMVDILFILFVAEQWTSFYKLRLQLKLSKAIMDKRREEIVKELDNVGKDPKALDNSFASFIKEMTGLDFSMDKPNQIREKFNSDKLKDKCRTCDDKDCPLRVDEYVDEHASKPRWN